MNIGSCFIASFKNSSPLESERENISPSCSSSEIAHLVTQRTLLNDKSACLFSMKSRQENLEEADGGAAKHAAACMPGAPLARRPSAADGSRELALAYSSTLSSSSQNGSEGEEENAKTWRKKTDAQTPSCLVSRAKKTMGVHWTLTPKSTCPAQFFPVEALPSSPAILFLLKEAGMSTCLPIDCEIVVFNLARTMLRHIRFFIDKCSEYGQSTLHSTWSYSFESHGVFGWMWEVHDELYRFFMLFRIDAHSKSYRVGMECTPN